MIFAYIGCILVYFCKLAMTILFELSCFLTQRNCILQKNFDCIVICVLHLYLIDYNSDSRLYILDIFTICLYNMQLSMYEVQTLCKKNR